MSNYRTLHEVRQRVEPFTYILGESVEKGTNSRQHRGNYNENSLNTLLDIATHKVYLPLHDLLDLNPELAHVPCDEPLPVGTRVHLPITPYNRGNGVGLYFILGDEESKLSQCKERLDRLTTLYERSNKDSHPSLVLSLPKRSLRSKTEQVLSVIHAETSRQLPIITEAYDRVGRKDQTLHYLVDINPVKEREKEIQASFSNNRVKLRSYSDEAQEVMSLATRTMSENYLTSASMQTVIDGSDDFCVHHSHRWEFVFYGPNSMEEQDAWAVLSCEPISALLDAFTCNLALPFSSVSAVKSNMSNTTPSSSPPLPFHSHNNNNNNNNNHDGNYQASSREQIASVIQKTPLSNSFIFIGGTFYVDDRQHTERAYEDLSHVIRCFNTLTERVHSSVSLKEVDNDGSNSRNNNIDNNNNNINSIAHNNVNNDNSKDRSKYTDKRNEVDHINSNVVNNESKCQYQSTAKEDHTSHDILHKNSNNCRTHEPIHTQSSENIQEEDHSTAFGQCPVRSASTTTFAEIRVKQGEYGVLRHLGECNHYFYLHKVTELSGRHTRTERDQFPHRVMRRREKVVRCQMCKLFPSTLALYGDPLSPHDPALYCATCYTLLHGNESEEEACQYLKVTPTDRCDYFKYEI